MVTKTFGGKKITIRSIQKSDLKIVKKFQEFMNSLIKEDAKIGQNKSVSLKEQKEFLTERLGDVENKKAVFLVSECDKKIIGTVGVRLDKWRKNHIGNFGIIIDKDYRGLGLGNCMASEIIKLARKTLKPKLKIIQLEVYASNKPAINLYKKMGFKIVARLPKQMQYKGKLVTEIIMMREL